MKVFLIVTVSVLLFSGIASGQSKEAKAGSYYAKINKAEMSIVYDDYSSALKYYNSAFSFKFPNRLDLYNAFVVAYKLKDTIKAEQYLDRLSYRNFYFPCDTSDAFSAYLCGGNLDSIKDAGYSDEMKRTTKFYSSIYEADQAVRKTYPIDTLAMSTIDSTNLAEVYAFIAANGFPSFEKSGFYLSMGSPFINTVYWLLLWHQRPSRTILDAMTEKAVLEGDFPPVDWASILAVREGSDKDPYHMLINDNEKLSPQQVEEIDKKRASIYLEPLADYKLKLKKAVRIRGEASKKGGYSFPLLTLLNENIISYLVATGAIKIE